MKGARSEAKAKSKEALKNVPSAPKTKGKAGEDDDEAGEEIPSVRVSDSNGRRRDEKEPDFARASTAAPKRLNLSLAFSSGPIVYPEVGFRATTDEFSRATC